MLLSLQSVIVKWRKSHNNIMCVELNPVTSRSEAMKSLTHGLQQNYTNSKKFLAVYSNITAHFILPACSSSWIYYWRLINFMFTGTLGRRICCSMVGSLDSGGSCDSKMNSRHTYGVIHEMIILDSFIQCSVESDVNPWELVCIVSRKHWICRLIMYGMWVDYQNQQLYVKPNSSTI